MAAIFNHHNQEMTMSSHEQMDSANNEDRRSQASELVDYIKSRAELFHDVNKDVFATDNETGETRRLMVTCWIFNQPTN